MRYDRPRYAGLLAGLTGIMIFFLLSYYNVFEISNYMLYDTYTRHSLQQERSSKDILLIEINHELNQSYDWKRFLDNLQKYKPKQIIFTSWPQRATKQFYQSAVEYKNVIFGRGLQIDTEDDKTFHLEPLPDSISDPPPPYGLVAMPPARYGIHRSQHAFFNLKGKRYPALEVLALKHDLGHRAKQPNRSYFLNFKGGPGRLPKITMHRVLTHGMVPELIEGRHVLIGSNLTHAATRLYTPLYPHDAKLSILEYHGLALDTLLSGQAPIELGKPALLVLMLLLLALNLFLYQWLNIRLASWLTLGLMIIYVLLGWILFAYTPRRLPVSEMLIVQLGTFLLVFREKTVVRERLLGKMLLDISAQMQERMAAPNFLTSHEHWAQVVGMLSQMLDLSRLILFERVSSDHRVKEMIAWQCSLEDIYERRRDFHRHPYSTAIHERKLLRIDGRPFLKTTSMSEDQYLIPLIFAGEVYGFWVFGIEPNKIDNIPQFEAVIEEFGSQIATLLYRRQQWALRSQSEYRQHLHRYLQLEGEDRTYLNLTKSLTLITQRLGRLENVFSHLSTATIVYNLFGNVVHVNKRMVDLLQAAQLTPYSMNLLDIMVALCNVDDGEAREFLRRIAFEKTHLSLPATLPNNLEHYYILHLRPIVQNDVESLNDPEEVQPFHMTGILCELVDITDIKQIHDFKIQVVEKIHNEIQGDLKSFANTFYKIEKDYQIPNAARDILIPIKKAIDNIILILDNVYKILNIDTSNQKKGVYPINIKDMINYSVNTFELPNSKYVHIDILFSGKHELAFASPSQLKYAIHTILELLVTDAIDNSQIMVEVQDDMDEIRCIFFNTGFGMPNARLQDYVFGSADIDSEAFMKLRQTVTEVRRWAGTLEAMSDMGVGLRFCLQLKAFL
jgi:CHASE2 domain-containing sensor protein